MPYVVRNENGKIVGLVHSAAENSASWIDAADPQLLEFLKTEGIDPVAQAKAALSASDAELARVVEDLIAVLIEKKAIMYTDLPEAAQHKLAKRATIRENLNNLGNLMVGEHDIL